MPMYRMLRSRTIDTSSGGDSPAARRGPGGTRKSSAGGPTHQLQHQKKMSVPGSPTKGRPVVPGQAKKFSVGSTMVASPLASNAAPPIPLPQPPGVHHEAVGVPPSPAAASLKKQRWSFAFRKRWFSSSVTTNSGCNSPASTRHAAKISVSSTGSQQGDQRRQSEGSYVHGISKGLFGQKI